MRYLCQVVRTVDCVGWCLLKNTKAHVGIVFNQSGQSTDRKHVFLINTGDVPKERSSPKERIFFALHAHFGFCRFYSLSCAPGSFHAYCGFALIACTAVSIFFSLLPEYFGHFAVLFRSLNLSRYETVILVGAASPQV